MPIRWLPGLRRGSAAACLLGLRVRIPPGAWTSALNFVGCQADVAAYGRFLVQRSVFVSLSVIKCNHNLYIQ